MNARTIQTLSISFFTALLLWGTYTLLMYIGMPIHGSVLLTDPAMSMVQDNCGLKSILCRGAFSLFPFLLHSVGRAGPFVWYALVCLFAYLFYLGWHFMQTSSAKIRLTLHPWKILLAFVALLWLIFTVLSFGSADGRPTRLYIEPTAAVYNVGERALKALNDDYVSLQARGCLVEQPGDANGAKLYNLKESCIQGAFFTRVLPQLAFVLLILFECLILGRLALRLLKFPETRPLIEAAVSAGLGAGLWVALLWAVAVAGIFTSQVGWALLVIVPVVCYQQVLYWLKKFFLQEWTVECAWYDAALVLGWLLLSYIAINFLTVVRPFPIGWDDLGSYLNRPRLLVSYGHFIYSMAPFDWGYLTSLGFLLFGYQSIFGATASMMINWMAGPLALFMVFVFANTFLGQRRGLLAALLYYSLPLVGHFSFADMKIDNAVFFAGGLATFLVLFAYFGAAGWRLGTEEETPEPAEQAVVRPVWQYLLLAGVFAGFAFSFKMTAIMVMLPLCAVIAGLELGWSAFVGVAFLSALILMVQGGFNVDSIVQRVTGSATPVPAIRTLFYAVTVLVGLAGIGYGIVSRRSYMPFLRSAALFAAGFAVVVLPWIEHNSILLGSVIPKAEFGAPNRLSPTIDITGNVKPTDPQQKIRTLPKELAVKQSDPACTPTGSTEELDRYWGFSNGWGHYLTLPWRTVMNADSGGYYVTTIPALLLFPLLLLMPFFWTKRARWLRWLTAATWFMLVEWIFLANGIPWYGIGVFLGLMIGLETMVARAPDAMGRVVAGVLVGASLLAAFSNRFWQFDQTRNIFEYSLGKVSADSLKQLTIPYYDDITQLTLQRREETPDRPYLYRIGTFIPYFIPKNLEVIGINDHQLDVFNCLSAEGDHALTLKRLKALGFNSIIFDTNTATIESDQNGSLHKKVEKFQSFVNDKGLGLQVVISDTGAGVAYVIIP
jgi:hypothetical protein